MFDSRFVSRRVDVGAVTRDVRCRDNPGRPVLPLPYGYPETHLMWHKVAARLAGDVVLTREGQAVGGVERPW